MLDLLGLGQDPFWEARLKEFYGWYNKSASKTGKDAWTWDEGKDSQKWSTTRGASKRSQSLPANPVDRTNPEEKPLPWRDLGALDTSPEFLYPGKPTDEECPVSQSDYLRTEHQQPYMQWIGKILDLDRRTSKDLRLCCSYCDMNNHPRFACKRPPIDERQEWAPPVPAQHVIYPNPGYKIEANVWQLDIRQSAF